MHRGEFRHPPHACDEYSDRNEAIDQKNNANSNAMAHSPPQQGNTSAGNISREVWPIRLLGLILKLDGGRLLSFNGDLLGQRAILFMYSLDLILARRQTFQLERPVFTGHSRRTDGPKRGYTLSSRDAGCI